MSANSNQFDSLTERVDVVASVESVDCKVGEAKEKMKNEFIFPFRCLRKLTFSLRIRFAQVSSRERRSEDVRSQLQLHRLQNRTTSRST